MEGLVPSFFIAMEKITMSMPGTSDVQFMNAYIQKLSQMNYQLTQKVLILETQVEMATQRIKELEKNMNAKDDGFGGADIIK